MFKIDGREISEHNDCYVIAEIGNNHQGSVEKCLKIIEAAKNSGADAVKLQKRNNPELFTRKMYDSPYENRNSFGKTYGLHRDFLEFNKKDYEQIIKFCKKLKITFFATPFDFPSADFLNDLDLPAFKIASGDATNTPLIEHVAKFKKPVLLSTGGCEIIDVERAYKAAKKFNDKICILQCTSSYPANFSELNLNVISDFKKRFPDAIIGYSGHDNGISAPIIAYILGSLVIEKHFTLNRTWKGTDQIFSLTPEGMRKMVRDLKRAKLSLGSKEKNVLECEKAPIFKMRKKLVASKNLQKNHKLTHNDIKIKSPGDGLSPYLIHEVIGKITLTNMEEDEEISLKNLK